MLTTTSGFSTVKQMGIFKKFLIFLTATLSQPAVWKHVPDITPVHTVLGHFIFRPLRVVQSRAVGAGMLPGLTASLDYRAFTFNWHISQKSLPHYRSGLQINCQVKKPLKSSFSRFLTLSKVISHV